MFSAGGLEKSRVAILEALYTELVFQTQWDSLRIELEC